MKNVRKELSLIFLMVNNLLAVLDSNYIVDQNYIGVFSNSCIKTKQVK
jgi:hypothetical protein